MNGYIFDIQHYGIYDGPGIRTLVFFKGCPLKCRWCHNPESQIMKPQISHFAEKCTGCGECVHACPNHAITLEKNLIVRNPELCVDCGLCAKACPAGATELIGYETTPERILEAALGDKPFYETSGGGVTVTGGEATMQPEFLLQTLKLLKENQIHTALETCGMFPEKLIQPLSLVTDLFLYDLKIIDEEAHKIFTGASNQLILSNFRKILETAGRQAILPRMPLIPGVNDNDRSIEAIAAFLHDSGYKGDVHLMPYNAMARTKWEKVGRGGEYKDFGLTTDEDIERISAILNKASFNPVTNF